LVDSSGYEGIECRFSIAPCASSPSFSSFCSIRTTPRRPAKRRIAVKDLLVLLNSPNRNASAERALQKTREALETALEQVGSALGSRRTDDLKKILRIALNLSRAKGVYEGLYEGRRLHEFDMKIKGNPSMSYLTKRIRRFPDGTGQGRDRELCMYMDSQIRRLTALRTVSKNDMPLPPNLQLFVGRGGIDGTQFLDCVCLHFLFRVLVP
jgi:hypothetical protein